MCVRVCVCCVFFFSELWSQSCYLEEILKALENDHPVGKLDGKLTRKTVFENVFQPDLYMCVCVTYFLNCIQSLVFWNMVYKRNLCATITPNTRINTGVMLVYRKVKQGLK